MPAAGGPTSPGDPGQAAPPPPSPDPSPAPSDPPAAIGGAPGPGGGIEGATGDGRGPMSDTPAVAGPFRDDEMTRLIVLAASVSTGMTMLAAFLLFGRRRRTDDPDDVALAASAAAPYGDVVVPVAPAFDPGTGGTDVHLPRWRRPSLLAARKSDPLRDAAEGPTHLSFAGPATVPGRERRAVRYRIVRLLDRPDELLGTTTGSLDEGDEVAVLDASGLYRRVQTPDGRVGWLHKMTLGDVIDPPAEPDAPIDQDVLAAYLAARGRS